MKWICQTFWTKPMKQEDIEYNSKMASVSLFYAQQSGYCVRMYTDSIGYEYLKQYSYNNINTMLDCLNLKNEKNFARSKFIALEHEPLGVIHIDFDVFLKKQCLDKFYNDKSIDVILQNEEPASTLITDNGYAKTYEVLKQNQNGFEFPIDHKGISNVGVIGFNNEKLKSQYIELYYKCVNHYENLPKYDFLNSDLYFEQVNINYLIQAYNYNVFYLLPHEPFASKYMWDFANKIGYVHSIGDTKIKPLFKQKIMIIQKQVGLLQKSNLNIIWASPKIDKTYFYNLFEEKNIILFEDYLKYDNNNMFRIYQSLKQSYNNSNKILIVSELGLINMFAEFSKIYLVDETYDDIAQIYPEKIIKI